MSQTTDCTYATIDNKCLTQTDKDQIRLFCGVKDPLPSLSQAKNLAEMTDYVLARALQALSDPYCQSTLLCVCVCLSVCLFVRNFDAKYLSISPKLSDLAVLVQRGAYKKVPMARRLVTSSKTSRDCMTSYM